MAPLNVVSRTGLVGTKGRQGPLSRTLQNDRTAWGQRATVSVSQRKEVKAFVHSFTQQAAIEYLIYASQVLDAEIWLQNPMEEKHKCFTKTQGA